MKTEIDWALKPEPWCWIGPAFKADAEAIAEGRPPPWGTRRRVTDNAATELRARRIAARLTQTALAQRVGCSHSTISHAECGVGSISGSMWSRIDAVLVTALAGEPKSPAGKYGVSYAENPAVYQAVRFQTIKADPVLYAARKERVNAARRRAYAAEKKGLDQCLQRRH